MTTRPSLPLQEYVFDNEAGPSGVTKKRGQRRKGKTKYVTSRLATPLEDTDEDNMDQSMQSTPRVPPLRTTWTHAQPEPVDKAPEEDDPRLPNKLMQAGDVEPNPGPLLHRQRNHRMS